MHDFSGLLVPIIMCILSVRTVFVSYLFPEVSIFIFIFDVSIFVYAFL
jgi:hypothetical protein